jgi:hypothetical protein
MKQSFLNSLKGLEKEQAEALVESEDLIARSVPKGVAITREVKPNTVLLWLDEYNTVRQATWGEGLAEDDTVDFDKYLGRKVLVDEAKTTTKIFGRDDERSTYAISKKDKVIADIKKKVGEDMHVRVWLPNTVGTMEIRDDRLNIHVDKQEDGSFEIAKIYVG